MLLRTGRQQVLLFLCTSSQIYAKVVFSIKMHFRLFLCEADSRLSRKRRSALFHRTARVQLLNAAASVKAASLKRPFRKSKQISDWFTQVFMKQCRDTTNSLHARRALLYEVNVRVPAKSLTAVCFCERSVKADLKQRWKITQNVENVIK